MLLLVPVRTADGTETTVRVRNISEGGLMAETPVLFAVGDEITAELRGVGSVPGKVVWIRDGRIGVAFGRTIDPKLTRRRIGGVRP